MCTVLAGAVWGVWWFGVAEHSTSWRRVWGAARGWPLQAEAHGQRAERARLELEARRLKMTVSSATRKVGCHRPISASSSFLGHATSFASNWGSGHAAAAFSFNPITHAAQRRSSVDLAAKTVAILNL